MSGVHYIVPLFLKNKSLLAILVLRPCRKLGDREVCLNRNGKTTGTKKTKNVVGGSATVGFAHLEQKGEVFSAAVLAAVSVKQAVENQGFLPTDDECTCTLGNNRGRRGRGRTSSIVVQ